MKMINGIEQFEIKLDNPVAAYAPGQRVSGKLILELNRTKTLRAIKLKFEGVCIVHWSETIPADSQRASYNRRETYFSTTLYVFGRPNGEPIEMAPGHRVFPFNYNLPHNIPNSFEHRFGRIYYSITAIFDRPCKLGYRIEKLIKIMTPLELEPMDLCTNDNGIEDSILENYHCCLLPFLHEGFILLKFRTATRTFACNDVIEVKININNSSKSIYIKKISLILERKLVFHATSKRNIQSCKIDKVKQTGPFSRNADITMGLTVPDVFPNSYLDHCNIIKISYGLIIAVEFYGCHNSIQKRYGIRILPETPGSTLSLPSLIDSSTANYPPSQSVSRSTDENQMALSPVPTTTNNISNRNEYPNGLLTLIHPSVPYDEPPFSPTIRTGRNRVLYPPEPTHRFLLETSLTDYLPSCADSNDDPPPSYEYVMANKDKFM